MNWSRRECQKITIDIEKTWQDGNNAEGKRPASVDVQLKNGDAVVQTLTITPDEEGNWKGSFENVSRYDSEGKEIKYTVQEVPVPGYDDVEIIQGEIEDDYKYPVVVQFSVKDQSKRKRYISHSCCNNIDAEYLACSLP